MRSLASGKPVLLLLALCATTAAAAGMSYPCYEAASAPVMDGVVAGDPAWQQIPAVTGFSKLGNGYTDAKQTWVQACWDDQAFYIGVTCEEPDVGRLQLQVRDGGPTWSDDGVEVFLEPGAGAQVRQFVVTAGGARGGFEGAPDFRRYQAAAHAEAATYSLEIRIPFELLGATPGLGGWWRGNFCRNIFTTTSGGDKFTCWAPLQTRFLEPEHFATIEFLGPAPDPARVSVIAERLNRPYRDDLLRRLQAAAAGSLEYVPALTEASQDPRFHPQARGLLRRWRQLERALRQGDRTPLAQLRPIQKGAEVLTQESYELKYTYLIATVLGD